MDCLGQVWNLVAALVGQPLAAESAPTGATQTLSATESRLYSGLP